MILRDDIFYLYYMVLVIILIESDLNEVCKHPLGIDKKDTVYYRYYTFFASCSYFHVIYFKDLRFRFEN